MDQLAATKTRLLVNAAVVAIVGPTLLPTFPDGSANPVVYAGDMMGARVVGARWTLSGLSGFTAADIAVQTSNDGVTWRPLKAFTQLTANGTGEISFLDTDPKMLRFFRVSIAMTGAGTSTHSVWLFFDQLGPRGEYAPPGITDRN